jgi:hypothetical protein
MFDARVFNIPKEEVTNCIYCRQLDASRNSVQMVGQAHFSHKELQNKSCSNIQDMFMEQKGINRNDFHTYQKRGTCVIKEEYQSEEVDIKDGACIRTRWVIDKDIPILVFSSSKERSLKEKSIAYFSQLVKTIDYSEVKDYNGQVLIDDVDENIDALIRVAFGNPNINVAAVTLSA